MFASHQIPKCEIRKNDKAGGALDTAGEANSKGRGEADLDRIRNLWVGKAGWRNGRERKVRACDRGAALESGV